MESRQWSITFVKYIVKMSSRALPTYSVAIRTLGKAGEKYQKLLESIIVQTHPPEKIVVYLAEGYQPPAESVGVEEIVVVAKGMVSQRACSECESEYLLLLDDDVVLAKDSAAKMCEYLQSFGGAYCVADVFNTANRSLRVRVVSFCKQLTLARKDDGWGVKICRNGSCSFNNSPSSRVVKSESGAGPASVWRRDAFRDICFGDEVWMDRFSYALGDDQLMFYKATVNGSYGLLCYDSGVEHLDAQSSQRDAQRDVNKVFYRSQLRFIIWYRSIFECSRSSGDRVLNLLSYLFSALFSGVIYLFVSILRASPSYITQFVRGQCEAIKYVASHEYNAIEKYKLKK